MRTNAFLSVLPEMVTFLRVAELGSFSAAARQLGTSPSAVSRQVSRLEKQLGVQLMQRTTRQLRLTRAGEAAFARCSELAAAAQAVLQVPHELTNTPCGRLSLSAPTAFARHVLHPLLMQFLAQWPTVDLHLIATDRDIDPIREGVDLMIRITRHPPEGFAARALMSIRQILCASPAYLAAHPAIEHPADLSAHSCLSLGECAHDERWRFRKGDVEAEVVVQGRYDVNHSALRLDAMLAGLGLCTLPDYVAKPALLHGAAVQVLPDWDFLGNYGGLAYALYPPTRFVSPTLRALIDHLVAAMARP
ncbi:LysR family transcriptional regulator [Thiomonas intermedia]|uniref:LysR family transcriptional regulator n=1 Tax=Thiomonas intermedia TaxID=926 RepID=UPI0009A48563|nr:LysR family transcriptional regulator [Thiomonas intermedia]